jgi:hypothetical protein
MKDAIELLKAKRQPNGRRAAHGPWPAGAFFALEKAGRPWNKAKAAAV